MKKVIFSFDVGKVKWNSFLPSVTKDSSNVLSLIVVKSILISSPF